MMSALSVCALPCDRQATTGTSPISVLLAQPADCSDVVAIPMFTDTLIAGSAETSSVGGGI